MRNETWSILNAQLVPIGNQTPTVVGLFIQYPASQIRRRSEPRDLGSDNYSDGLLISRAHGCIIKNYLVNQQIHRAVTCRGDKKEKIIDFVARGQL